MRTEKRKVETINTEAVDKLFLKDSHLNQIKTATEDKDKLVSLLLQKNKIETQIHLLKEQAEQLAVATRELELSSTKAEEDIKNLIMDVYGPINLLSLETGEFVKAE